jgi:hypothetical protein
MTSRSDRQCFTFQRHASPKKSSFRPMSIVCFSSRKRGRRTNGNFRFGRSTFRSYGNTERPLPAQRRSCWRREFLVELRGFEPLTSAVEARAAGRRFQGSILPRVRSWIRS